MLRKYFLKFESISELHKELTNILLIATGESNYFYCYCNERRKCDLCDLCSYLFGNENLMEGLPPKKFLQLNYAKGEKLEDSVDWIFPFFVRMEYFNKRSVDFFNKEYVWSCKSCSEGTYSTLTLTEIIDNDKEFVKNNSKFFDKEFLKKSSRVYVNLPDILWGYDDMTILHDDYIVIFLF